MTTTSPPSSSNVTIEAMQDEYYEDSARILATFLNSKHMCCCIPLGWGEDNPEKYQKLYQKQPAKKEVAAVAIIDGLVVGVIQLLLEGMHSDTHKARPGEAYIDHIAVEPDWQGKGVGGKLMLWAETTAVSRGCKYISLEVMKGNPAIRLYQRKGFRLEPHPCVDRPFIFLFLCCFMGPIICPAGSPSYCSFGVLYFMRKDL